MVFDANAPYWNEADGIPWDDLTTADLKSALANGDSVEEIAIYLQFSPETVRQKMAELGLKARDGLQ